MDLLGCTNFTDGIAVTMICDTALDWCEQFSSSSASPFGYYDDSENRDDEYYFPENEDDGYGDFFKDYEDIFREFFGDDYQNMFGW